MSKASASFGNDDDVNAPLAVPNRVDRLMMKFLKSIRVSKSGASAAEYALILAVVGSGIVGAAIYLKDQITLSMNNAANVVKTPTSAT